MFSTGEKNNLRFIFTEITIQIFLMDKRLFVLTLSATNCMIFFMPITAFYPLMISDYFQGTACEASSVELLYSAGMMIGTFVINHFEISCNITLPVPPSLDYLALEAPHSLVGFFQSQMRHFGYLLLCVLEWESVLCSIIFFTLRLCRKRYLQNIMDAHFLYWTVLFRWQCLWIYWLQVPCSV